jgi:hypothetical protein
MYYRVLPDDLAVPDEDPASSISALVLLSDGGFQDAGVQNLGDGGFSVNVPVGGKVYLRVGAELYVTSGREISLDSYVLGRPGQGVASEHPDIQIAVTASGLAISDKPEFIVHTPNTGYYGLAYVDTPLPSPVESVNRQQFVLISGMSPNGGLPSLLSDATYVLQTGAEDPGALRDAFPDGGSRSNIYYTIAKRAAEVRGVVLGLDGGSLEVVFGEPSAVGLSTTIRASEWAPVLAAITESHDAGPVATKRSFGLGVAPIPWNAGLAYVWPGYSGDLVDLHASEWPVLDLSANIVFDDGLPAQWLRVVAVRWSNSRTVEFASGDAGVFAISVSSVVSDIRPLAGPGDIKPRLWPPSGLEIEGADGHSPGELATQTPLVSWVPPMGASPSGYRLGVSELGLVQGKARRTSVLVVRTEETSVRLPPGVLATDKTYVFSITAFLCPGHSGNAVAFCFPGFGVDLADASVASAAWVVK